MYLYSLLEEVEKRNFQITENKLIEFRKSLLQTCNSMQNSIYKQLSDKNLNFLWTLYDNSVFLGDKEKASKARNLFMALLQGSKDDNKKILNLFNTYDDLIKKCSVTDNLKQILKEQKEDTFYYIGINEFVLNYYKENPNSEWKIKAVLQYGFPFEFGDAKKSSDSEFSNNLIRNYLANKKWSLFIFTKKPVTTVTLGFDNRNTYANLENIRNERQADVNCQIAELPEDYKETPFVAWDSYNEDHYRIINEYLNSEKIPVLTNAEEKEFKYSFNEIPCEYFRIDYLDYLSRYKKSVIEVFDYPEKNEKIKKLENIVKFVNAPGKEYEWPDEEERKDHVLIKDFFFKNGKVEPIVRIGEQNSEYPTFWEEYEIQSFITSPYYLYCLLSSELVTDYYSDHYEDEKYYDANTPLPLEDCIFIEMSSSKMCDKKFQEKYERDINPKTKAHDMITTKNFSNQNAKESIEKYLAEIHNDIKAGSFYSATILMGSVLEAFLIDWLSEIDDKDYFSEDYMIMDKNYKHARRADLKDYIDAIQKKRPDWITGAKKATEIRKKRNLVHAKLYIAEGEISQDICYEMLQNLEAIINNRWNK